MQEDGVLEDQDGIDEVVLVETLDLPNEESIVYGFSYFCQPKTNLFTICFENSSLLITYFINNIMGRKKSAKRFFDEVVKAKVLFA